MSQRSANRKGWGTRDTTDPLTPAQLNTNIPFLQTFIPAGAFSGGVGTRSPIFQTVQIASRQQTMFLAEFPAGDDRECYAKLGHRSLPFFNYTDPKLKCYIEWMQIDGAAPSPDEFVTWEAGIGNAVNGATYNFDMEPTPAVQAAPSLVLGQWIHAGVGQAADAAVDLPVADVFGSSFDADNWNGLILEVERFGNDGDDTFTGSAYFIGAYIQYATDFNNNSEWPVV
jgi:hypothetical protein